MAKYSRKHYARKSRKYKGGYSGVGYKGMGMGYNSMGMGMGYNGTGYSGMGYNGMKGVRTYNMSGGIAMHHVRPHSFKGGKTRKYRGGYDMKNNGMSMDYQ